MIFLIKHKKYRGGHKVLGLMNLRDLTRIFAASRTPVEIHISTPENQMIIRHNIVKENFVLNLLLQIYLY